MATSPSLEEEVRGLFYTTTEKSTVEQRDVRRLAKEVIDHFDVATNSNLSDHFDQDRDSFRNQLTDDVIRAP